MQIHAFIITTTTELVFIHETSPVSPINLSNFAKLNLLTHLTNNQKQPPLAQSTIRGIDFIILRENELAFIFCHSNASAIFCQKLKEIFQAAFESVTRDQLNQQSLTNNIDLSFDLLRRMLQFGQIHEVDL